MGLRRVALVGGVWLSIDDKGKGEDGGDGVRTMLAIYTRRGQPI